MVLPFILLGAAVAAGGFGIGKGARAVGRVNEAKGLQEQAHARYEVHKALVEKSRVSCQSALETLGKRKFQVMDTEMRRFAVEFGKLKNVRLTDVPSMAQIPEAELQSMEQPSIGLDAIDGLKTLVASGAAGATAGFVSYGAVGALATASTGAAITGLSGAAAANATLAWFGGGALSAGGLGMAGGAWILGSIVTGPVLAIGGMVMSAKSKEALANAKAQAAKAAQAIEEMITIATATGLIQTRAEQIHSLLHGLWEELRRALPTLEQVVKREMEWSRLSRIEQESVASITALSYLIRQLIDAPLFDAKGQPIDDTGRLIEATQKRLATSNG